MNLDNFFTPKSVAVIGASHTPGKVGHSIVKDFLKAKFQGKIFPVNPDTTPILGLETYASVKDIPERIDLAVIAVPAKVVEKVLKECISKKINSAIIITSGFSETGKEGKKLEEKLKKIIRKKIRVIGPNCLGIFDSFSKVDTLFLSEERMKRPDKGNIAFISQSGAVGSTILDWLHEENIGISKFISYGNGIDVNEVDLITYLAKDEKTRVIAVYLEGIKSDGRKFFESLKRCCKIKPIIILKAGKSEKGTKAVISHTGSLAGSSEVFSAVFKQTGAIEAANWEEFFDYIKVFSTQPFPRGERLAIVTDGGGFGVLATDEAERQGLVLKEPSKNLRKILEKQLPPYVILHNPFDLSGDATAERYRIVMEECLRREYDGAIAIVLFQVPTLDEKVVDIIPEIAKKYQKPVVVCSTGGKFTLKNVGRLESNGIPVYPTPERAVKAFSLLLKYKKQTFFKK